MSGVSLGFSPALEQPQLGSASRPGASDPDRAPSITSLTSSPSSFPIYTHRQILHPAHLIACPRSPTRPTICSIIAIPPDPRHFCSANYILLVLPLLLRMNPNSKFNLINLTSVGTFSYHRARSRPVEFTTTNKTEPAQ